LTAAFQYLPAFGAGRIQWRFQVSFVQPEGDVVIAMTDISVSVLMVSGRHNGCEGC